MIRPLPVLLGAIAAVVLGAGVSTAVVRSGDETASGASTTTIEPTTTVVEPSTTAAPATTLARVTTTRVTTPRPTTPTTARPVTTLATTTSTRAPLTWAAATGGLCSAIETSVRQVVGGNPIGGGLRLAGAITDYASAADPAVVAPARRMLSAGLSGDLDASAAATLEAAAACQRAGFPIVLPGGIQCVQAPCP